MNVKIQILLAAIPALIVGIGQNLADSREINKYDINHMMLPQAPVVVQHVSSQPQPFKLAARDGKEENCHWLGTCQDRD
jgi:hypothetical protein